MEARTVTIYQGNTCYPGILRIPDVTPAPAVAFHMGYGAFKEMYDAMATCFCKAGYVTLQYDGRNQLGRGTGYFHCGTEWLEDAGQAVSFLTGLPEVDQSRIGFTGLSMGGGVTITQGSLDRRIKCLYAMAPVPSWKTLMEEVWTENQGKQAWEDFLWQMEEDAARTAHGFPSRFVNAGFGARGIPIAEEEMKAELSVRPHSAVIMPLESLYNSYLYMDAYRAAHFLHTPICIVHGTADTSIPCKYSQAIYDVIPTEDKQLHFIEGAGHVLTEDACETVNQIGLAWFDRWLKP